MQIIQIVGYKGSGKTTLAKTLITSLAKKGIKVASLKHHGHGGIPVGMKETDSEKHRQAGAIISGVEGQNMLQLSNQNTWKMEQMIAIYKLLETDVLVIEGFKQYNFNKIVLIRNEEDLHLLEQMTNIRAVMTQIQLQQTSYPYPVFKQGEIKDFHKWFFSLFLNQWEDERVNMIGLSD